MFKQILKHGIESGNVYYNIGNCYFKSHNYGHAMLYYKKAKKFIPHDKDLNNNIELINRLYVKDKIYMDYIIYISL